MASIDKKRRLIVKIDLEQIYTLQFTMGLRYRPMQIRHNIKLLLVALLFFFLDSRRLYEWTIRRFEYV